jgi:hypothetical protein
MRARFGSCGDRFDSHGEAKMELFDYIEVFYNQRRRHSTIGQVSPAAFEKAWATQAARSSPRPTSRPHHTGLSHPHICHHTQPRSVSRTVSVAS